MATGRKLVPVAAALLVLSLTGCEGGTLLVGTITDAAGKPVAAATITLDVVGGSFSPAKEWSTQEGAYHIHVVHAPERTHLVVTVSKDGFEPFTKKFLSKGTYEHLNVKLKPVDPVNVRASQ